MSRSTAPTRTLARRLSAAVAALAIGLLAAIVPAGVASADGVASGRLVTQLSTPTVPDPILGLAIEIWSGGTLVETLESDPVTGEFAVTNPLPDGGYYYWVHDGWQDDASNTYDLASQAFYITGGNLDLGDIVVAQYVPVSGTITNWLGDVRVQLYKDSGGSWTQEATETFSGGTFAIYAPIYADDYTLIFILDDETVPFTDAYLGGGYEPDDVLTTRLTATPGVGFSGLSMTLPDAAVITGRVTDSSGPLAGVEVWAEDDPDYNEYAEGTTDVNGVYTLYVRPGLTYVVGTYGDPTHAGLVFDGFECDCSGFTPVLPTVLDPAVDIDFELTEEVVIEGVVIDDGSAPDVVDGLDVKLYKLSVGGVWVLHDEIVSIYDFPAFGFVITSAGEYRIQFVDADGDVLMVVDGATEDFYGGGELLDPVPACYAELNERSEYTFVFALVDLDTVAAACAALVAEIPPATPPSGGVKKPRGSSAAVTATPTPTATPSSTPTSSATPRPSTSPSPTATPGAEPTPASGPDLWWLLWVIIGILLIVIVGGVVYFVRRA